MAAPSCADGQVPVGENCVPLDEAAARITEIVTAAMGAQGQRAAIVGFAVDGGPRWMMAAGESMTGVPATTDMHFRNGAVAIAYLGTLLLQLADAGVLSLDDKVSAWFPDYPRAEEVTLRMLINCTSGYADYVPDENFERDFYAAPFRHWTEEELIGIGLGHPMHCAPGTCWSYAHTNFVILGRIMAKATGRPLAELIADRILTPLGLQDTRSEITARIQEPPLHAFTTERGRYEESSFWNPSWTLAHGAIMTSSIGDLLTTASAVGRGTLVSRAAHEAQLAPETARMAPWNDRMWFGYGVVVINGWVLQTPLFSGYRATMAYLPSRGLAIAVTTTLGESGAPDHNATTDIAKEIAAYLAPEAPIPLDRGR